eukprot:1597049-Rhodomonas_salina.1
MTSGLERACSGRSALFRNTLTLRSTLDSPLADTAQESTRLLPATPMEADLQGHSTLVPEHTASVPDSGRNGRQVNAKQTTLFQANSRYRSSPGSLEASSRNRKPAA